MLRVDESAGCDGLGDVIVVDRGGYSPAYIYRAEHVRPVAAESTIGYCVKTHEAVRGTLSQNGRPGRTSSSYSRWR